MKHATAEKIIETMLDISRQLDGSVKFVMDSEDQEDFKKYRGIVGSLMGSILLDIMNPIFSQYPDLTPEELRSPKPSSPENP